MGAEVLPAGVKKIAMEAGVSGLWYKYADKVVGVDRFGISAPGDTVMQKFGMTAENLVKEAKTRLVYPQCIAQRRFCGFTGSACANSHAFIRVKTVEGLLI